MRKRPLVVVALLYAAGLLAADGISVPLVPLFASALGVVATAAVWPQRRGWLLAPVLILFGWTNLTTRTALLSPHDLRSVIGENAALVTVRGMLVETPYQRVYERDEEESWRTLAWLDVAEWRQHASAWQPAFGRVAVATAGLLPGQFFAGQTVEIAGTLRKPGGPVAEGAFDYRTYLRRQGIHYQLQAASANDWRVVSTNTMRPLSDRFCGWAQQTLALGLPEQDEPLRLLWAMTLGWKTALTGEVAEPFMRSGTMHVFAISGLHIALIAGILVAVFRVARVPRGWCGVFVIPMIWFYTYATGWQASAIRSTVMMTIIIAGWSLRRPSDLLNSLAAAALIILVWDPQQLFQASFQLSFFVVLSLALFAPVLEGVRRRWLRADPLLPAELRPRWQRWVFVPVNWLAASFATSLAAWLGSIPLVAYYFHLFTPVSLLANIVVVPLSGAALAANLGSLIVGAWFPACAELFNHSAWFFMHLMIRASAWAAHAPGGCFHIGTPTLLTFALYYGALISVMAGGLAKPHWRAWVGSALAVLAVAWVAEWQIARSTTRLTVVPLHGGEMIHCDAPGTRDDALIDCGSESAFEFSVKPFLRARGVSRVPRLVLTHGDSRNVGGAALLREQFSVSEVYLSPVTYRSPTYRRLKEQFDRTPGLSKSLRRGDRLGLLTVLHPDEADRTSQADDSAMVLRFETEGVRVLLLSDLGKAGQTLMMNRSTDLRADIVVSGLPVQTEPLADALIDAIQPRAIVITDSEYPATARASRVLRTRLAQRHVPVIYTRETGAVTLEVRNGRWRLRAMNGMEIRSDDALNPSATLPAITSPDALP